LSGPSVLLSIKLQGYCGCSAMCVSGDRLELCCFSSVDVARTNVCMRCPICCAAETGASFAVSRVLELLVGWSVAAAAAVSDLPKCCCLSDGLRVILAIRCFGNEATRVCAHWRHCRSCCWSCSCRSVSMGSVCWSVAVAVLECHSGVVCATVLSGRVLG
jgi:hypothetical protein